MRIGYRFAALVQFQRSGKELLTLEGEMDGARLQLQLHLQDRSKLMLVSRGFHWVQERSFAR